MRIPGGKRSSLRDASGRRDFLKFSLAGAMEVVLGPPCARIIAGQGFALAAPMLDNALRTGFETPPQNAKLRCYWWWLNGNTTADTITRDLTGMKAKGYGGALLVDADSGLRGKQAPPGPNYGSPEWKTLYLHALKVAANLGLQISLSITSGGNVGILGGPSVEPKDAMKLLTYSRMNINGGSHTDIQLSSPPIVNGFYQQIAVLAYPLRHGTPLPGEQGSGRKAIERLAHKIASRETGMSMPSTDKVLRNAPSVPGEEDAVMNDVVDLSSHVVAGTLHWKFPAGKWEILCIGYTDADVHLSSTSGNGLALDFMNARAFDHYWDRVVVPLLAAAKTYIGKSLCYLVTDSWEAGGTNWTQGFREEFLRRRGYDPVPYLPIVAGRILDSRETSNRFLADLRRTVGDLITINYYDHFAERAAEYGLGTHPESGGPHGAPIDALETFRKSAFPHTEFWAPSVTHRATDSDRFFVKEASCAAHIYGKPYVAAEGLTYMGPPWTDSPGRQLAPAFDHALTEGLNRLFWHEFSSSPAKYGEPGIEYFAGTHLNPNVTWWREAGPILLSINRAQYLLQQGRSVSDLLYYYGDQVPSFVRLKADDPAHVLPGYDYDVTNEDALLNRMQALDGDLRTPEGLRYRALALPVSRRLSLPALIWVEKYVREGGVLIGPKPISPLGLVPAARMKEFNRIASAMWKNGGTEMENVMVRYGRGRIYCTQNAHKAFTAMHVAPDLTYRSDDADVAFDYVHRQTKDADIYFVRNEKGTSAMATLLFRVKGRAPELWQVDTGEETPALIYREKGARTEVPLSFPPHGSIFVIFERPSSLHAISLERDGHQVFPSIVPGTGVCGGRSLSSGFNLVTSDPGNYLVQFSDGVQRSVKIVPPAKQPHFRGPWTVSFPSGWGAPASITMNDLRSWTDVPVPGVRYFSGTATYHKTIQVPAGLLSADRQVWMDLGNVREIATVTINGQVLRTLWRPPFVVRIDPALHSGTNRISIQVTNLWRNRLVGDLQPSAKVHYTETDVRVYTKDSPLLPSGLLSPVTLKVVTQLRLQ